MPSGTVDVIPVNPLPSPEKEPLNAELLTSPLKVASPFLSMVNLSAVEPPALVCNPNTLLVPLLSVVPSLSQRSCPALV